MKSKIQSQISAKRSDAIKNFLLRLKIDPAEDILKLSNANLIIINEALTHTSAKYSYNHEKLEFLGDAVLRLAASEFIENSFPNMNVGDRSSLRAQIVSDNWLSNVGDKINIEDVLITGAKVLGDDIAVTTLKAEATEALIGGIYECCKNLKVIHKWLTPYWEETSIKVLKNPKQYNSKSALQEWAQSKGLKLPKYETKDQYGDHGNPKRFSCKVILNNKEIGKGVGRSIKEAEKEAAKAALQEIFNKYEITD